MTRRISIPILLLLALQACQRSSVSSSHLPVTGMQIGSQSFSLEIAVSDNDQAVGLMHRDNLPSDHGMIFVNNNMDVRTFWNHDVHFPLDLLFLDSTGNIVSIKHMRAWDDTNVSSDVPAQYVIELNDGTANKIGVNVGMRLDLPVQVKSH